MRLSSARSLYPLEIMAVKPLLGDDVTFHTLRHTFASWYAIRDGDLYRLQKYLGHSTIALTQRYAHLSPDFLKAGAAFFGPPDEAVGHNSVTTGADAREGERGSPV